MTTHDATTFLTKEQPFPVTHGTAASYVTQLAVQPDNMIQNSGTTPADIWTSDSQNTLHSNTASTEIGYR